LAEETGGFGENHQPVDGKFISMILISVNQIPFIFFSSKYSRGCHVCDRMVLGFIPTYAINVEVYSIQHYVIKFVSDLRQVGGFLRIHSFSRTVSYKTILLFCEFDKALHSIKTYLISILGINIM
jgi:hypothetical protein